MEEIDHIQASPDHAIVWRGGRLYLLDQRALPERAGFLAFETASAVADAIADMVVRGAPAIGITAAYGAVLGARARVAEAGDDWLDLWEEDLELLADARPTAVNLGWALARMRRFGQGLAPQRAEAELLAEAERIHREDIAANRRIGQLGAALIEGPANVITHCNAGALATGGYGTALGVVRSAFAAGKLERVFADETRPWLQGARLTAWELLQDQIPVTLLADAAAASRMAWGDIAWVVVGADRIAANGDVANKIGTYGLALAARHHGVRFMVAAPTSTLDLELASGAQIPIECRDGAELLGCGGRTLAAPGAGAWNPVFDVTPAELVDAIVTEKGVVLSPDTKKLADLMRA
jgi:methylthioribose-1-phosphate isomerase